MNGTLLELKQINSSDLSIQHFTVKAAETWCMYGDNLSGTDSFVDLLSGESQEFNYQQCTIPAPIEILSFKGQQELFEEELRNDDTDFLGHIDPGTLVKDFLQGIEVDHPLLLAFQMEHCLDLGYRQLSSGQCRKLLLLQKLLQAPKMLVVQNPYDGLDERSCNELNTVFEVLAEGNKLTLLVFVSSKDDIPNWCTHLGVMQGDQIIRQGRRSDVLADIENSKEHTINTIANMANISKLGDMFQAPSSNEKHRDELISLKDGWASYGDKKLFVDLNLTIKRGDHTLITGPNGCGKSTLLAILTGDNPNCYANDLRVLGKTRGSGESIWEIKQNMGIVSPALHRDHRVPGSALHIILSGLFDSIGLYKKVHNTDIQLAGEWLAWLGFPDLAQTSFRQLPFAKQRLVLIARALIKQPQLLILDEPTQGLDDYYRAILLDTLEKIASEQLATILYVSHRKDEYRSFFCNQIQLDRYRPE